MINNNFEEKIDINFDVFKNIHVIGNYKNIKQNSIQNIQKNNKDFSNLKNNQFFFDMKTLINNFLKKFENNNKNNKIFDIFNNDKNILYKNFTNNPKYKHLYNKNQNNILNNKIEIDNDNNINENKINFLNEENEYKYLNKKRMKFNNNINNNLIQNHENSNSINNNINLINSDKTKKINNFSEKIPIKNENLISLQEDNNSLVKIEGRKCFIKIDKYENNIFSNNEETQKNKKLLIHIKKLLSNANINYQSNKNKNNKEIFFVMNNIKYNIFVDKNLNKIYKINENNNKNYFEKEIFKKLIVIKNDIENYITNNI